MFTALVKTLEQQTCISDEQTSAAVDSATSDLAHTVHSLLKNNVLPPGCYFSCSGMKSTATSVAFACNPLRMSLDCCSHHQGGWSERIQFLDCLRGNWASDGGTKKSLPIVCDLALHTF